MVKMSALLLLLSVLGMTAFAQNAPEVLRPPKGSQVAIVVFEDLQCPDCRRRRRCSLRRTGRTRFRWVRHDFPLPMHNWSNAGRGVCALFRDEVKTVGDSSAFTFSNINPEVNPDNLRGFAEKFAAEKEELICLSLLTPTGRLAALINADKDLGTSIGLNHTPTIYVVSNKPAGKPFVEVVDRSKLYQLIDSMKQAAAGLTLEERST